MLGFMSKLILRSCCGGPLSPSSGAEGIYSPHHPRATQLENKLTFLCHPLFTFSSRALGLKMSWLLLIGAVWPFAELNKNPVEGFSAGLIDDDDIYKWEVVIIGPQDTLL